MFILGQKKTRIYLNLKNCRIVFFEKTAKKQKKKKSDKNKSTKKQKQKDSLVVHEAFHVKAIQLEVLRML